LCQKCNGPLSTNCVTCPNSKYLFNGECLDDCPFGYFISGSQCHGLIFINFIFISTLILSFWKYFLRFYKQKQCVVIHV